MAYRINTLTNSAFNLPVNISSTAFTFRIVWNTRTESWYLDVEDGDGNTIERGIRLSPYQPLIVYGIDNWPLDGNLFVAPTEAGTDLTNEDSELGRNNFGGSYNYQLFYVPREEYDYF